MAHAVDQARRDMLAIGAQTGDAGVAAYQQAEAQRAQQQATAYGEMAQQQATIGASSPGVTEALQRITSAPAGTWQQSIATGEQSFRQGQERNRQMYGTYMDEVAAAMPTINAARAAAEAEAAGGGGGGGGGGNGGSADLGTEGAIRGYAQRVRDEGISIQRDEVQKARTAAANARKRRDMLRVALERKGKLSKKAIARLKKEIQDTKGDIQRSKKEGNTRRAGLSRDQLAQSRQEIRGARSDLAASRGRKTFDPTGQTKYDKQGKIVVPGEDKGIWGTAAAWVDDRTQGARDAIEPYIFPYPPGVTRARVKKEQEKTRTDITDAENKRLKAAQKKLLPTGPQSADSTALAADYANAVVARKMAKAGLENQKGALGGIRTTGPGAYLESLLAEKGLTLADIDPDVNIDKAENALSPASDAAYLASELPRMSALAKKAGLTIRELGRVRQTRDYIEARNYLNDKLAPSVEEEEADGYKRLTWQDLVYGDTTTPLSNLKGKAGGAKALRLIEAEFKALFPSKPLSEAEQASSQS